MPSPLQNVSIIENSILKSKKNNYYFLDHQYKILDMDISFKKDVGSKIKWTLPEKFKFLTNIKSLFYYFWFLVLVGVIFYCTSLFQNYFTTPFTGDYTSQEFAFYTNGYDDWWHFLTTGEFVLFDTNTFLGANNIGANSFYYLFSPFFMPILMCPRQLIPQGMAILTIFKNTCAGMIFYGYMRYLGASRNSSKICGLAYGYCGWMVWYLWFNHFTDVTLVFPLILFGIEKVLKEKKPWILIGAIALSGFTNFFFMICFVMSGFMYAMFRYFQGIKKHNAKDNLIIISVGFFAFLVGLLMSCMVTIPSIVVSLTAPRAKQSSYLTDLQELVKNKQWGKFFSHLFSWSDLTIRSRNVPERVYFSLLDFVFPVASDRGTPLVVYSESYDNVAGSLFVYYPFIVLLIPALIKSTREKHFSPLIATAVLVFMCLTPFSYYMFHGFTKEPYSRWSIFVTTSIIAYVGLYLDKVKDDDNWPLIVGLAATLIMVIASIAISMKLITIDNENNEEIEYIYRYTFTSRAEDFSLIIVGVIVCVYVLIVYFLIRFLKDKKFFYRVLMGLITFECAVMGVLTIQGQGIETYVNSNNGLENNNALRKAVVKVNKNDKGYFRCYSSLENEHARNDSMRNGYNGLGFFHSVYDYDMAKFLNWSQITDGSAPDSWSGSYVQKRFGADLMLGVKYYFVENDWYQYNLNHNTDKVTEGDELYDGSSPNYRVNVPLGYVDVSNKYGNNRFRVYENKYFIDFGYTYDNITAYNSEEYPESSLKSTPLECESAYTRYAIADYETVQKIQETYNEEEINIHVIEKNYIASDLFRIDVTNNGVGQNARVTYYDVTGEDEKNEKQKSYEIPFKDLLKLNRTDPKYPIASFPGTDNEYKDRYVTIIDNAGSNAFPYDENGMIFYINNSFNWDYRINVYFVDENNQILTFDDHNDQNIFASDWATTYRSWRGYYVAPKYDEEGDIIEKAPVIDRIIIVNKGKYLQSHTIYYESGTQILKKLDNFKQYPIENVHYKTNHFDFTTNFEKNRVVISQIPYDLGWKIKAINKADGTYKYVDIFNGQGGFVSFVAEKGDTYYSMDYYTPYLKLGSYLTAIGVAAFLAPFGVYYYIIINSERRKVLKTAFRND